jgi:hypothetical protein
LLVVWEVFVGYVGVPQRDDVMFVTRGRDFFWNVELVDQCGDPLPFPPGDLFFEFVDGSRWFFDVDGSVASLKVESEVADTVANRARWQLVFLPEGEPAGGTAWAKGYVKVEK